MTTQQSARVPHVSLISRKPHPGFHFSVENNRDALIPFLKRSVSVESFECPYESRGVWRRLANALAVALRTRGIRHITGDVNYLGLFLSKSTTIQTILDCGGMNLNNRLRRAIVRLGWIKWPAERSAVVVTISDQIKHEILALTEPGKVDIRVIPLALHPDFRFQERSYQWDQPRVLLVGSAPNKNLERQLEALKQTNRNFRITVCGEDTREMTEMIARIGINVHRLSNLTTQEMAQTYRRNDILLYASTYEGFGMPIMEAQASGTLVITSDRPPMSQVGGLNGALLVDPEAIDSISTALARVLDDEELRDGLIESGRANAQKYTPDNIARLYVDLYEEVEKGVRKRT